MYIRQQLFPICPNAINLNFRSYSFYKKSFLADDKNYIYRQKKFVFFVFNHNVSPPNDSHGTLYIHLAMVLMYSYF